MFEIYMVDNHPILLKFYFTSILIKITKIINETTDKNKINEFKILYFPIHCCIISHIASKIQIIYYIHNIF